MRKRKTLNRRQFFLKTGTAVAGTAVAGSFGSVTEASNGEAGNSGAGIQVIKWTATDDELNFRFDFVPNAESTSLYSATPEDGMFSHHPFITHSDGVLIAAWDNHLRDENGSGQRSYFRISADNGNNWAPMQELFPPLDEVLPATEAYIGRRSQKLNGLVSVGGVTYALSDVADWGGPSISQRYSLSRGMLSRSIGRDGRLGDIFRLGAEPYDPVDGFPSYPAGDPVVVRSLSDALLWPGNELQLKFGHDYPDSDDHHRLSEPTGSWRLADGTRVRLYRDNGIVNPKSAAERESSKSRRNYSSLSFDDGRSWTTPTRTSFPDACARSNVGVLPDGQVYVINNVLPLSTKYGGRVLLAISLSKDGIVFDRTAMIRFNPPPKRDNEGRAKSTGYQYPHSVVMGSDLWVVYSVNKEDIEVTRIPFGELERL